jgi:hypothetical protein
MFIKSSIMLMVASSLCLTNGLKLGNKRIGTSVFRTLSASVTPHMPLNAVTLAATNTAVDTSLERLSNLRIEMKKEGIDCIIVPTEDPHMSEYTAPYYYRREFISGFTGNNNDSAIG